MTKDSGSDATRSPFAGLAVGSQDPEEVVEDSAAEDQQTPDTKTATLEKRLEDTLKAAQQRITEASEKSKELDIQLEIIRRQTAQKPPAPAPWQLDADGIKKLSDSLLNSPEDAIAELLGIVSASSDAAKLESSQIVEALKREVEWLKSSGGTAEKPVVEMMNLIKEQEYGKYLNVDEMQDLAKKMVSAGFVKPEAPVMAPPGDMGSSRRPDRSAPEKPTIPEHFFQLSGADNTGRGDQPLFTGVKP